MIRLQRTGRTNNPAFRIVLLEKERSAKAGNIVEQLGTYNPKSKEMTLNQEKTKEWLAKGAQPTDSIRNLFISNGIINGKKINVLPKKTPIKSDVKEIAEEVLTSVGETLAEDAADVAENVASEVAPEVVAEAESV